MAFAGDAEKQSLHRVMIGRLLHAQSPKPADAAEQQKENPWGILQATEYAAGAEKKFMKQ